MSMLRAALLGFLFSFIAAATEFVADIEAKFVPAAGAKQLAKDSGKPLMVLVTQPWCGACKNLKRQINEGSEVKTLMDDFIVVHAVGDEGEQWKESGHGYVPQTYFFHSTGEAIAVTAPNPQYKYFFGGEGALAGAMKQTLKENKKAGKDEL